MDLLKAVLIVIGVGVLGAAAYFQFEAPRYDVAIRLQTDGIYTSRNLGTLFEAEGGETICRAGFPAAAQTRGKISQKHLEFTCGPREPLGANIEFLDLGRPAEDGFRSELRSLRDQVVDVSAQAILSDGRWEPFLFEQIDTALGRSASYVQAVQIVSGEKLTFPHSVGKVMYKDTEILKYAGSLRNGVYYDGTISVAHFDSGSGGAWITYCSWIAPATECSGVRRIDWPYAQDIYGMLGWNGALYMSTGPEKSGKGTGIWQLDPRTGALARAFPSGEELGGEFYGMAIVGDSLVAGHYPTGYLAIINADGSSRFVEEPKPQEDTFGYVENQGLYREAQSLNLYAGRLWVGMYPWGFLWEGDPSLEHWQRHRLFSWPEVSNEEPTPFHSILQARYLAMSKDERAADRKFTQPTFWGQRIHSVALSGDENAVLFGLGNMPGLPYDESRDEAFGSWEEFSEYGAVRGVRAPNTIIRYIPWTEEDFLNLSFSVRPGEMILKRQGRVVERIPADIDSEDIKDMHLSAPGFGLYGATEYVLEAVD